jgi:hypothetical protein
VFLEFEVCSSSWLLEFYTFFLIPRVFVYESALFPASFGCLCCSSS